VKCPSAKRLAAASLGADPRAELHADSCERCSAELAAMAEVSAFARRAPVRVASAERRARIAALVMASSDAAEPTRTSRLPIATITVAGLAAVTALVIWRAQPAPVEHAISWPVLPASAPHVAGAPLPPPVLHDVAPPVVHPVAPPAIASKAARETAPAPQPRAPAPGVTVSPRPAATTARVFAGSQEHASDGELARDQVTLEPSAFERGWIALREARYADAITAFDRATDAAVAEDAAYWAAIASARAGDRRDAARRLSAFVATFPASARLGEARALLVRLAP
jgi:hypothetical protein